MSKNDSFDSESPRTTKIDHQDHTLPPSFARPDHDGMKLTRFLVIASTTQRLSPSFMSPHGSKRSAAAEATVAASEKRSKTTSNKTASSSTKDTSQESTVPWYTVYTKGDREYDEYMATEWGFEKRGDVALFEKLSLEGAQSGLSWQTILRKRQAYRQVFYGFDIDKVAKMSSSDVERIISMQGDKRDTVVRHRGKIESVINNAKCILKMRHEAKDEQEVFDKFMWSFVNDKPILNRWSGSSSKQPATKSPLANMPCTSPESEAMSKALKKQGFKFVGPTTCYALMQAMGMVIDHPKNSPEWEAARQRLEQRPGGYQQPSK